LRITLRNLVYLLLAVLITGCQTISTSPQPTTQLSWKDRQAALSRLQTFKVSGKIAVQTSNDSGSATLIWLQNQQHYTISILGPFGSGSIKLTGNPGQVTLETADGKQINAKSPEALLAQEWGFNLPVSYLRFWIRGLPAAGAPYQSQFDSNHRLSSFTQQGWQVQYLSYQNIGTIDLPEKISITSPTLKSKIIIHEWSF
jgi:outer membrane lipoprotein LolB